MGQFIDLTGKRFGKLTAIERVEDHIQKGGFPKAMWRCVCDCGSECITYGQELRSGRKTDCGCGTHARLSKASREHATTHGGSKTRLYKVWRAMRERRELDKKVKPHTVPEITEAYEQGKKDAWMWTPTSESRPPIEKPVLVCDCTGYRNSAILKKSDYGVYMWQTGTGMRPYEDIVAWQKLPESYREDEE